MVYLQKGNKRIATYDGLTRLCVTARFIVDGKADISHFKGLAPAHVCVLGVDGRFLCACMQFLVPADISEGGISLYEERATFSIAEALGLELGKFSYCTSTLGGSSYEFDCLLTDKERFIIDANKEDLTDFSPAIPIRLLKFYLQKLSGRTSDEKTKEVLSILSKANIIPDDCTND